MFTLIIKTIKTDKATINIMGDGTVKKIFNNKSQAEKEFKSLLWLFRMFVITEIDGWLYKVAKPIDIKGNKMIMKKAKGVTLETEINNSEYTKKTGVWLALFHKKSIDNGMVKRIDYNRKNIIIDGETKTLTVIDPGAILLKDCAVEFSVLDTVAGLVIGALKQKINPKPIVKSFLDGYHTVSKNDFILPNLKNSLNDVINTRFRIQQRKNKNALISFIQLYTIKVYVRLFIFPILKKQSEHTAT